MKILITNPLLRKTFDLISILNNMVNDYDLIYAGSESMSKIKFVYGNVNVHKLSKDNFEADLHLISQIYINEVIIYMPIEEDTTIDFYSYINKFGERNFKYKLPPISKYHLSRDKNELNMFCETQDIPCPKYYSERDIKQNNYILPLILKPINGSGSKGIRYMFANNDLVVDSINFEMNFIQELLDNPKDIQAGFFLCDKGSIVSFYSHQRLRTFPEQGGVSVFSKSDLNVEIRAAGKDVVKKLNWSGFIMIEFLKCSITGKYKLIEINPRLWGSIMLSEFCGANFINGYIKLCLNKQIENSTIKEIQYIRWVFPYDILYFIKNPQNPLTFFKKNDNTCYINFSYTNYLASFKFICLTYFNLKKMKQIFYG